MTTFFFVRHGVTSHTGHKLSGWLPGIHLTDEGRSQADAVAEKLAGVPLQAVYASPIDRTMETARPIAARHGIEVQVRRRLGEVEFGKWTNRSFKSLTRTKLWEVIQRVPSTARFPEGESFAEVQARAIAEIDALHRDHPRDAICCVSHADVIKLIAAYYLGLHIDFFQRLVIAPASVTVIALDKEPRIVSLNSTVAAA